MRTALIVVIVWAVVGTVIAFGLGAVMRLGAGHSASPRRARQEASHPDTVVEDGSEDEGGSEGTG